MEDLITQRFRFASITLYKDYCNLEEKKTTKYSQIVDPFSFSDTTGFNTIPFNKPHRKTKTKFFYNDKDDNDGNNYVTLKHAYKNKKSGSVEFDTTKDRHIKRHFANPFARITLHTIERSVRRHGDKITIKIYKQYKSRDVNSKYFKKHFNVESLTINLKTGNFTILSLTSTKNGNATRFRTNSFFELSQLCRKNSGLFKQKINYISTISNVFSDFEREFSDLDFNFVIGQELGFKFEDYSMEPEKFVRDLIKFFVEKKKIKTPNEYENLLCCLYPTEKYLKKNDRKLVSSILDMFGIKSKITIKLLHKIPNIDVMSLSKLCYLLGKDHGKYIGNISEDSFKKSDYNSGEITAQIIMFKENHTGFKNHEYNINDDEKDNIVRILNTQRKNTIHGSNSFIDTIYDHFNMIKQVSEFDPNIRMRAKNFEDYYTEHTELSKMITAIQKGWVIEYQFHPDTIKDLETPLDVKINLSDSEQDPTWVTETFYPVILKREEEYVEEGKTMHHCVATYADKDKSIIVSIRTKDMTDRVTCEFDTQTGICVQARHFCNGNPPGDMELAVEQLKLKTKKYAKLGMLNNTEKKRVPVKINGIEIKKEIVPVFPEHLFTQQQIDF